MELAATARLQRSSRKPKLPQFQSLAALIKSFGECAVLLDSDDTIAAIWASRNRAKRRLAESLIGAPADSVIRSSLLRELRALGQRTAALNRREEIKVPLQFRGKQQWFSVRAIPFTPNGASRIALCLIARDVTHRVEAQRALAEREALLAQAEEIANFGSWELDLRTEQVKLSPQLLKIYELAPGSEWSREAYWSRVHPGDRMRARQLVLQSVSDAKPARYMARYCTPDGRTRVHLAHSLPIRGDAGEVERTIGVIQDVTEHAESRQQLQRLSQQLMTEQDEQRRHLARELHESAGQSLAALKMTLGRLRQALAENSHLAASLLKSAATLADDAAREVRTVSYVLHPPMLDDAGLRPALRWYAKGFAERSGIFVAVEIADAFPRYSREIETAVFRVVQEALTNVHRYSGSASAEITVTQDPSQLRVEIRDHGCGFPIAAEASYPRAKLGVGISGMRERLEQLGGTFEIESVPGEGTIVRAAVPSAPVPRGSLPVEAVGSDESREVRRSDARQSKVSA
ncbi:MAG: PAS domain-containing protein [Acidobacteriota bacterium]|nr:PAS domain-containing protein [Acidobacteriota bacterium]